MNQAIDRIWIKRHLDEIKRLQDAMIVQQAVLERSLESLNNQSKIVFTKIIELEALVDHNVIPALEREILKSQKLSLAVDMKVPDCNPPDHKKIESKTL